MMRTGIVSFGVGPTNHPKIAERAGGGRTWKGPAAALSES
jgi:hypothetical protein